MIFKFKYFTGHQFIGPQKFVKKSRVRLIAHILTLEFLEFKSLFLCQFIGFSSNIRTMINQFPTLYVSDII